MNLENSLF